MCWERCSRCGNERYLKVTNITEKLFIKQVDFYSILRYVVINILCMHEQYTFHFNGVKRFHIPLSHFKEF